MIGDVQDPPWLALALGLIAAVASVGAVWIGTRTHREIKAPPGELPTGHAIARLRSMVRRYIRAGVTFEERHVDMHHDDEHVKGLRSYIDRSRELLDEDDRKEGED